MRLLRLLPLLPLLALSVAASEPIAETRLDDPAPLVMPLRRAPKPKRAGAAASQEDKLQHRHLRARAGSKKDDAPATKGVGKLDAHEQVNWGFFTTVKFGDEEATTLVDTGSADLWVASSLCEDCNKAEIIIDRAHPDLSSVRPVVDLDKAKASLVDCASEMCTGTCTTEFLEDMGIKSAFCGPHGGVCANLTKPRALQGICAFGDAYMDGSIEFGALVQSPAEINGIHLKSLVWGALADGNINLVSKPESGGILGLQSRDCDATLLSCYPSFLDTVTAEKGLPKVVSYCGHGETPVLVVGGTDAERLAAEPVQYTPAIDAISYTVGIESITFGDEALPLPEKVAAIADTGTTLAFIPQTVFDGFKKAFQVPKYCEGEQALDFICETDERQATIFDFGINVHYTDDELARFPTLTLKLPGGPTLELQGKDYMFPLAAEDADAIQSDIDPDDGRTFYSLGIGPTDSKGFFVLGQLFLRKYYIEYDIDNKRVGFAPAVADCVKAAGL